MDKDRFVSCKDKFVLVLHCHAKKRHKTLNKNDKNQSADEESINAPPFSEMGARLRLAANLIGMDKSVSITGKSAKQLKRYCEGAEPPFGVLRRLADAAEVSLDWLAYGKAKRINDYTLQIKYLNEEIEITNKIENNDNKNSIIDSINEQIKITNFIIENIKKSELEYMPFPEINTGKFSEKNLAHSPIQKDAGTDFIALPFLDIEASAGHGAVVAIHEDIKSVVSFERAFLRSLGAAPDRCKIITARGDSMTPTIPDGALIVIDHSQREVVNGWISVVNVCGDLLVKRIRRRLDGTVELVSDNPIYPVETIGDNRIDELLVIGRVVYFCRAP